MKIIFIRFDRCTKKHKILKKVKGNKNNDDICFDSNINAYNEESKPHTWKMETHFL